jgi:hypothetical protein
MTNDAPRAAPEPGGEEPPPVLGSWRNLYALVIAVLAAIIAFLIWLTKAFA